jgi:predicted ArsR family transcriptional regulator
MPASYPARALPGRTRDGSLAEFMEPSLGPAVPGQDSSKPTRRQIVDLLKWNGPMTVADLAGALGITAVAARRHLDCLEADRLVRQDVRSGGRGRPAHLFALTRAGDELFPRNYDQLVLQLLAVAGERFGPDAVDELLAGRRAALADRYRDRTAGLGPGQVAAELARIQDENGYMADVHAEPGGCWLMREHNCAIPAVAARHAGACGHELDLLRELAGPGVEIERVAHIRAGDQTCAYRLRPARELPGDEVV